MQKILVVANWKCNPTTLVDAKKIFNATNKEAEKNKKIKVVVCPPFIYLLSLGANGSQNCFWEEKGAFTGEISPTMLKNSGTEYVVLGHSERRTILMEDDDTVNKKIKLCLKKGLKVVFCIGETEKEKNQGGTFKVLKKQITQGLKGIEKKEILKIIFSYEPIWAIGTGTACSSDKAVVVKNFIADFLRKKYSVKKATVLYGGSVNEENAVGYVGKNKFNGLLVGGASLDPKKFTKILVGLKNLKL